MRRLSFLFVLLPVAAFASQPIEMTQHEFKMYRHWQKAMQDPQVEKIKPAKRNAAIARDAHFKLKDMEEAIAKGDAAGDLKAACTENLKEALAQGPVAGRVGKIDVDLSEPHGIAYVEWQNENVTQLEEEASFVAATTAKQCPVISTITVWAQDKANPKSRVFQALISRDAAARIKTERAKDFADTMYIRLFEQVKNIAKGDTFDVNSTGSGANPAAEPGSTETKG